MTKAKRIVYGLQIIYEEFILTKLQKSLDLNINFPRVLQSVLDTK